MITKSTISELIPADFAPESRVWVYQSSRPFVEKEQREVQEQLEQFYLQWQAHGAPVKGWAQLLFGRFVVMMADERDVQVSGCSIDSSVRILKSLEKQYDVQLFDRLSITFLVKDKPEVLPFSQVQYAIDKGYINGDTLLFNNVVTNRQELLESWLQPLKDSWLAGRVNLPA
ncbi:MAG: hypothetical protein BGO09_16025 [Bacteroidetes bacterium 47-18]|nr:MAG: hypothetical protein BGO09_16025 [Bacteroidetes bacterium 47-18]